MSDKAETRSRDMSSLDLADLIQSWEKTHVRPVAPGRPEAPFIVVSKQDTSNHDLARLG